MKNFSLITFILLFIVSKGFSQSNTALDFDGLDDQVYVPSDPNLGLSNYSIEFWMKTTYSSVSSNLLRLVDKQNGTGSNYHFFMRGSGTVRFQFSSNTLPSPSGHNLESSISVNDGKWHHIAGTFDNTTKEMKLYIDGVLNTQLTGTVSPVTTSGVLTIGSSNGYSYFDGQMDEVRIWNHERSQNEIVQNMNHTLFGTELGLVAYYNFEEGVANGDNSAITQAIDIAGSHNGNVNNLSRIGTSSNWVTGKSFSTVNTAMDFDGNGDYIQYGAYLVPTTGDFTVEFWVYNRSITGWREFISQGSSGDAFYIGTTTTTGEIRCGDKWGSTGVVLSLNKWEHISLVKSGTNAYLYVNGEFKSSKTGYFISAAGSNTFIGKQYGGLSEYPNAIMDEFRVWNRALSQSEIDCRRMGSLIGNEAGLVAYYDFEEGVESADNTGLSTVFDKSTNSNHGSLNGFTRTGSTSNWVSGNSSVGNPTNCPPSVSVEGSNGYNIPNNGTPMLMNKTDFGRLSSGGSVVRTFTITNSGSSNLELNGTPLVSATGSSDFSVTTQPAATIVAPGATTTFQVTFNPSGSGKKNATLSIASNDPNSPFAFEVSGSTNTAMDFDGSNDNITYSNPVLSGEKTVEIWIKTSKTTQILLTGEI